MCKKIDLNLTKDELNIILAEYIFDEFSFTNFAVFPWISCTIFIFNPQKHALKINQINIV